MMSLLFFMLTDFCKYSHIGKLTSNFIQRFFATYVTNNFTIELFYSGRIHSAVRTEYPNTCSLETKRTIQKR